ncbi:ABC transporter ATPase [Bacteroidota bacterium]
MLVDYEILPEDSKVWIYPSNRKFYPTEIAPLEETITAFLNNWKQGEEAIECHFKLHYNRILVITSATNMSLNTNTINLLVAFIINLQESYDVQLLDKMNVCFKQGEHVQYKDLKTFKELIKGRAVTKKTIVFDNMVATKIDFENYWELPASESWYGNLFKK